MSRVFFIQASLAVKNRWGLPQLFMEKDSRGEALLKFLIGNVRLVKAIDKVCVVTSDKDIDNEVVSLVNDLAKETAPSLKPLMVYRVASDKPYAFSDSNIMSEKLLNNIPLYGLYSASGIIDICADISCEQGLFLAAEEDIAITFDFIDKTIAKYGSENCFIKPIYLFEVNDIKNSLRQYLIKFNNDNKILLADIASEIEEIRQMNRYMDEQLKELVKLKKTNFTKAFEQTVINTNVLIGFINDKQRKKDINMLDFKNAVPLLNRMHLSEIKETVDISHDLSIEKFINILTKKENTSLGELAYPGYLEIEITSKCNLSCQYCPQTRLTRPKEDMSLEVFKSIVDETVSYIPFLSISGYGEPLLNTSIVDAVKYAKEQGFFRVCLETNATLLEEAMLDNLSKVGLDILVLNLNAIDAGADFARGDLPSADIIEKILSFNEKTKDKHISLVLQVIKTVDNNELIEFYHNRWQYIVDKIVIRPFNDFLGQFDYQRAIDFSPLAKNRTHCAKTMNSLLVLANGRPSLCLQKFDESLQSNVSLLDAWRVNRILGGTYDFCIHCKVWHLLDYYSSLVKHGVDVRFIEDKIYSEIVPAKFLEGEKLYNNNEYEKALDVWENVLKVYPHHKKIHAYLNEMLNKQ